MIKGVNKQIVEINCTRDEYIERAILFVNPQKAKLPRDLLEKKAGEYLNSLLPEHSTIPNERKPPLLTSKQNHKQNHKQNQNKFSKLLPFERVMILALIGCCVAAVILLLLSLVTAV